MIINHYMSVRNFFKQSSFYFVQILKKIPIWTGSFWIYSLWDFGRQHTWASVAVMALHFTKGECCWWDKVLPINTHLFISTSCQSWMRFACSSKRNSLLCLHMVGVNLCRPIKSPFVAIRPHVSDKIFIFPWFIWWFAVYRNVLDGTRAQFVLQHRNRSFLGRLLIPLGMQLLCLSPSETSGAAREEAAEVDTDLFGVWRSTKETACSLVLKCSIEQCKFADFHEDLRSSWKVEDESLSSCLWKASASLWGL